MQPGSTPEPDGGGDAAGGAGGTGLDAGDTVDQATDASDDGAVDNAAAGDTSSTDVSLASNCGVAGSLLIDCGFELPMVTAGYLTFSAGQSFSGWMVVGPGAGNVSPLNGAFQQNGFSFPAHEVLATEATSAPTVVRRIAAIATAGECASTQRPRTADDVRCHARQV